jgi:esterase/lipase
MRTRKYKKKKKQTKKIRGGSMSAYEFEILKLQRVIDKYGESDRVNLQELQDKINQAIINYIMKSSTEKKQIIDKIDEIYDKTFVKREKIE